MPVSAHTDAGTAARLLADAPPAHWRSLLGELNARSARTIVRAVGICGAVVPADVASWIVRECADLDLLTRAALLRAAAPALRALDPRVLRADLQATGSTAVLEAVLAEAPSGMPLTEAARELRPAQLSRLLPAYLSQYGLSVDIWEWLMASRRQAGSLPLLPFEVHCLDLVEADLRSLAPDTYGFAALAGWLVGYAPVPAAARICLIPGSEQHTGVSSSRADDLLAAGADPTRVMAFARRWPRPSWNETPRLQAAAAAHGAAEGLALLDLGGRTLDTVLARPDLAADPALVLATATNRSCAPASQEVRVRLLGMLAGALIALRAGRVPELGWVQPGDCAALREQDPQARQQLDDLVRQTCSMLQPGGDLVVMAECVPHLPLPWSLVRNPVAWQVSMAHLHEVVGDQPLLLDTATGLLVGWCGSIDELGRAAAALH